MNTFPELQTQSFGLKEKEGYRLGGYNPLLLTSMLYGMPFPVYFLPITPHQFTAFAQNEIC